MPMNRFGRPVQEAFFNFAGNPVLIRVAGKHLARRFFRPFAHLQATAITSEIRLTIELWDEHETDTPFPVTCDPVETGYGLSESEQANGILTSSADGACLTFRQANTLAMLDRNQGVILGCCRSEESGCFDLAKPLISLLSVWYYDRRIYFLHAGLAAKEEQGLLFCGPGGSGKSTTLLSCVLDKFHYLADDITGIRFDDGEGCTGFSVFNSVCMEQQNVLNNFKQFAIHAHKGRCNRDKWVLFLSELFPRYCASWVRVKAIVLPRIFNGAYTRFVQASKAEALLRLAPSTLFFIRPSLPKQEAFEKLADLVSRLPAYWLNLGRDRKSTTRCVNEILAKAKG